MVLLLSVISAMLSQPGMVTIDPYLLCSDVTVNHPMDSCVASVTFHHPAFNPRSSGMAAVCLDDNLPPPFNRWIVAEINPSPGANRFDGYVVLRNEDSGKCVVLHVEDWKSDPMTTRKAVPAGLRPSTRPSAAAPGIGCTMVVLDPKDTGESRYYASLVGGEFVADCNLGWFHEGQLLPRPWADWRVTQVLHGFRIRGQPGPQQWGVVLTNEKTGATLNVPRKRIGLPSRATTHPSDDLILAATTRPS